MNQIYLHIYGKNGKEQDKRNKASPEKLGKSVPMLLLNETSDITEKHKSTPLLLFLFILQVCVTILDMWILERTVYSELSSQGLIEWAANKG